MNGIARDTPEKKEYYEYVFKRILVLALFLAILIVIAIYSLTIGGRDISFVQAAESIWNHITGSLPVADTKEWWDDYSVWNIRLPRILVAIIAGASLALGGAAMQPAVKNPLADPYTTGISSGAVFGVAIGLVMGFTISTSIGHYGLIVNAFVFGLIPALIISAMSKMTAASPATIILTGVAISYLFQAMSTLLLISTDAETLQQAYTWQIGTLQNVVWDDVPVMFVFTLIGGILIMLCSSKLNILTLGDESARSLGLSAENFRILLLILISLMTASVVAFIGIIGFIGLVSPHIIRMLLGSNNRFVVPASALVGSLMILFADLIARTIIYPGEVAVGVVMSFIGAPIFLILIIRTKKAAW